ncbi:MAG: sulfite exporter TauE/SafE family protein [Fretibacterium sp.]|nr:sulfite exporter TauE/SafE family protein [Fretibacterium sp.]
MNREIKLNIRGMSCVNRQNRIEKGLRRAEGVLSASVSYNDSTACVLYDENTTSVEKMIALIEDLGYQAAVGERAGRLELVDTVCTLTVIVSLYVLLRSTGILNLLAPDRLADTGMGYGMLFVIGLITSVHCVAMCGGINLAQSLPQRGRNMFLPSLAYNAGRILSYAAIGFALGLVGLFMGGRAEVGLSTVLQGTLKIIAGLFMVIMGINMLNLFPWLRRLTIRLPRFLTGWASRGGTHRPFIVGLLNGFMPCGPLQSMWLVALASGGPFAGAFSMFLFGLGTAPLMLGLGSAVSALGRRFKEQVMTVGAVLVVVLGLAMLSQGGALAGIYAPWDFLGPAPLGGPAAEKMPEIVDGVQVVNSTLSSGRYPSITVQAGIPVRWVIDAPKGSVNGCNYKMLIQEYGIEYTFKTGSNVIDFTPADAGTFYYSCWMGMIRGSIVVL